MEGRALLSRMGLGAGHGPTHGEVAELGRHDQERGILAGAGMVRKFPMFYPFYTGPRQPYLNVVSGSGRIVNNILVLTGNMAGRIPTRPANEAQESYFVFGLNRGGAAVAPFFQRPGVRFDSVVVVSVEAEGISARLVRFESPSSPVDLPAGAVSVRHNTVQVKVPLSLLPVPTGGVEPRLWTWNLWPRDSLDNTPQPNHGSHVASFLPENTMAEFGFRRR